ncbi:SPFH/Band 7/PHB domain protein [Caldichromatium japonicum]|uniref:SPFH/Band 7/PHB domain protein n=1 Tax=Caldichromatium japonicum TaxID=2699430 RepID=A0A6G7VCS7_9GAMM|nr:SPFH domain-containing protein [Caldichromatium japonicum]QIK37859.1 SPFH/Band 7/PHB domain protein [Caldichromatium japonicum]
MLLDLESILGTVLGFVLGLVYLPLLLFIARACGLYTIVREREAHVFTLFGKVIGTVDEPGLRFPLSHFGLKALLLPLFGKTYRVSICLRQHYLRNLTVNSEEGTLMGVGIWYEMRVSDPVAYLFNNANPDASLQANVASSTILTLSNLKMDQMLEDRHQLSCRVRTTVSPLSEQWDYTLGSVYIRKVSFTDQQMVENITEKVVKRLVQVTSAMKQYGENRVGLIKSETAYKVSRKLAEAAASRPAIVGAALNAIARNDPEILEAVLAVMETDQLLASHAQVDVLPQGAEILIQV